MAETGRADDGNDADLDRKLEGIPAEIVASIDGDDIDSVTEQLAAEEQRRRELGLGDEAAAAQEPEEKPEVDADGEENDEGSEAAKESAPKDRELEVAT